MPRLLALVVVLCLPWLAFAQSAALSLPVAVVKDADGKVMAQVTHFVGNDDNMHPRILLNVDGVPAWFTVYPVSGLLTEGNEVYFSLPGCVGNAAIAAPGGAGLEGIVQTSFEAVGPDPITGTYRLIRSTSPTPGPFSSLSRWAGGSCHEGSDTVEMCPAEEVTPNPLEGFHGPTDAEPERVLTIAGGDRIRTSVPQPNGSDCTWPSDCISGFCVDDFCCDTSCDGVCESCSTAFTAGPSGTCSPIFAGIDPDDECGSNCCDGAGACDSSGGC